MSYSRLSLKLLILLVEQSTASYSEPIICHQAIGIQEPIDFIYCSTVKCPHFMHAFMHRWHFSFSIMYDHCPKHISLFFNHNFNMTKSVKFTNPVSSSLSMGSYMFLYF